MNRVLLHWWPLVPALLIVYLGGSNFLKAYPRATPGFVDQSAHPNAPDSLLAFIQAGLKADALARTATDVSGKIQNRENPFRPVHGSNFSAERSPAQPKVEPPLRKYVLKGTVGNEVATIADHTGRKLIVKVGDGVDSAIVLSIEPNKVILKDRAGKFELLQEK